LNHELPLQTSDASHLTSSSAHQLFHGPAAPSQVPFGPLCLARRRTRSAVEDGPGRRICPRRKRPASPVGAKTLPIATDTTALRGRSAIARTLGRPAISQRRNDVARARNVAHAEWFTHDRRTDDRHRCCRPADQARPRPRRAHHLRRQGDGRSPRRPNGRVRHLRRPSQQERHGPRRHERRGLDFRLDRKDVTVQGSVSLAVTHDGPTVHNVSIRDASGNVSRRAPASGSPPVPTDGSTRELPPPAAAARLPVYSR
jgi:hypothetical protein